MSDLSDGLHSTIAQDVFVENNDVYVVGTEFNGTKRISKFWKNGIATNLSDGNKEATAMSIFVSK